MFSSKLVNNLLKDSAIGSVCSTNDEGIVDNDPKRVCRLQCRHLSLG